MRKLKETTLAKYSARQLVKHLRNLDQDLFRVETAYNTIYRWDEKNGIYRYYSDCNDKFIVKMAIRKVYALHN